ncbi:MAG: tetratricopeptide repeat protein [Leptolyngbyaceae cyanobacterium SM2_5_2]|nr:tetratricopeptide repeat protein [Leptolyngbyaceae cyanobacterium SM2_5_2]
MPISPMRGLGLILGGWLILGLWLGCPTWALSAPYSVDSLPGEARLEAFTQAFEWGDRCVRELQSGQQEAAVESCNRALRLDVENPTYRLNYSVALYRSGHYQAALEGANVALRLNPQDYRGYYNRGLVQVALHNFVAAIADFDRAAALGISPALLTDVYNDRGLAKLMANRPEEAIADFDRALMLNSADVRALFNRGCACHQLGHIDGALTALNQVLALEPDHARTYLKRGLLRQALGDQMGGIADLQQAADCAQAQGQPHLYHYVLTLLNEWQSPGISVG